MKFSYTINGKRFTEKMLIATYGEARVEKIKQECAYLHRFDPNTPVEYGRRPGTLIVKVSG